MFEKGKHFINKDVMLKNLLELKAIYEKNEIPFFLIFGTLLGAVREKDFISYDNDVDLACLWEDRDKILALNPQFEALGYTIETHISDYDINYIKDGEKIEVWLFEDMSDVRLYDKKRCNNIKYLKEYFEKTELVDLRGKSFPAPSNPRKFLEVTYGSTWVIPKTKGSYIL